MRKFERVEVKRAARGSANAKPNGPLQTTTNLSEPATGSVAVSKLPETGFLLDWLSGGEAFPRNIKGFPLRFEALG
jgi:hypothetical protein